MGHKAAIICRLLSPSMATCCASPQVSCISASSDVTVHFQGVFVFSYEVVSISGCGVGSLLLGLYLVVGVVACVPLRPQGLYRWEHSLPAGSTIPGRLCGERSDKNSPHALHVGLTTQHCTKSYGNKLDAKNLKNWTCKNCTERHCGLKQLMTNMWLLIYCYIV